jgi:hypothetical protein
VNKAPKANLVQEVSKGLEAQRVNKDHVVLRGFEEILMGLHPTSCWQHGLTNSFRRKNDRSKQS